MNERHSLFPRSNCSGNLQGNRGMVFGRVFKTNRSFYIFLGWSSSFEGSPLSLLACFFLSAVYVIDQFKESVEGTQKLVHPKVCRNAAVCGSRYRNNLWDLGKFEWTSTGEVFFFRWKHLSNSIQSNLETCAHIYYSQS